MVMAVCGPKPLTVLSATRPLGADLCATSRLSSSAMTLLISNSSFFGSASAFGCAAAFFGTGGGLGAGSGLADSSGGGGGVSARFGSGAGSGFCGGGGGRVVLLFCVARGVRVCGVGGGRGGALSAWCRDGRLALCSILEPAEGSGAALTLAAAGDPATATGRIVTRQNAYWPPARHH